MSNNKEPSLDNAKALISRFVLPEGKKVRIQKASGVLASKYFSIDFVNAEDHREARYRNNEPNFLNRIQNYLRHAGKELTVVDIEYNTPKEWEYDGDGEHTVEPMTLRQIDDLRNDVITSFQSAIEDELGENISVESLSKYISVTVNEDFVLEDEPELDRAGRKIETPVSANMTMQIKISPELALPNKLVCSAIADVKGHVLDGARYINDALNIPEHNGPFFDKEKVVLAEITDTLDNYRDVLSQQQLATILVDNIAHQGVSLNGGVKDGLSASLTGLITPLKVMESIKDAVLKETLMQINAPTQTNGPTGHEPAPDFTPPKI